MPIPDVPFEFEPVETRVHVSHQGLGYIPHEVVSRIPIAPVRLDLVLPDNVAISVVSRIRPLDNRRFFVLPRGVARGLSLPAEVAVTIRPAPADVAAQLHARPKMPGVVLPGDRVVLPGAIIARDGARGRVVNIPSTVGRGITQAGWPLAVQVDIEGARYEALLQVVAVERGVPRYSVRIPTHVLPDYAPGRSVVVALKPLSVLEAKNGPLLGQAIDLAAFTPDGATAVRCGGTDSMALLRHGSARTFLLRRVAADMFLWFLGYYLADGHKTTRRVGLTGALLDLVGKAVAVLASFGVSRDRIQVTGRCPYGGNPEAARAEIERVVGSPVGEVVPYDEPPRGTVGQSVIARIDVLDGVLWAELVRKALRWVWSAVDELPPELLRAFVIGYLDGDGGVTLFQSRREGRVTFSAATVEEATLLQSAAVRSGLLDSGSHWRIERGRHEAAAIKPLTGAEAVRLLLAGAFRFSLARARLLLAYRDALPEGLDGDRLRNEITRLREATGVDDVEGFILGAKCVPYPLGPRAKILTFEDLPVDEIDFRVHGRPEPDSDEEAILVQRAFEFYRRRGFPYPDASNHRLGPEFEHLRRPRAVPEDGVLPFNSACQAVVYGYHPELFDVAAGNGDRSATDAWGDDDLLRRVISRRVRHDAHLRPTGLLKGITSEVGVHSATTYPPVAAKRIYDHFKPRRVLDPCAGWGSRMLAAMAAEVAYVGIDPHAAAAEGNRRLATAVRGLHPEVAYDIQLVGACAEEVIGRGAYGEFDLTFTSPPYFNREEYSTEPTQSYLRYVDEAAWFRGFLAPCMRGAYQDLVRGGHLVLAVGPVMVDRVRGIGDAIGFESVATWKLKTPIRPYAKRKPGRVYREDPILVFKKS